tara:strand:+ start:10793 stop:10945 length:153 start_codon:yes stop_codon:yes gene_type:complete
MNSIKKWLSKLFEGMAYAFIHPVQNSVPPNIGTHAYRDKPFKANRKVWNT